MLIQLARPGHRYGAAASCRLAIQRAPNPRAGRMLANVAETNKNLQNKLALAYFACFNAGMEAFDRIHGRPPITHYMKDKDIRPVLMRFLAGSDPTAAFYHELRLSRGEGRADCVSVNGSLSGYEIKSDSDSLARLSKQISDYERVFDYCTIVVGQRHLARAKKIAPIHWGIMLATADSTGSYIKSIRKAKRNANTEIGPLVRLLWKTEAIAALRNNGVPCAHDTLVREVWRSLESLPKKTIAREVRYHLKLRAGLLLPQIQCGD